MSTILGCCAWAIVAPLILAGLWTAFRLGWDAHHRPTPAPRVNQDVLAPHAPLYGARRLAVRPVPPVLAGYTPAEQRTIDTIWYDGPAPLAPHHVNWQAQIIERKN